MPLKLKSTFFSDRHNYKNLYLLVFFAASIKKVRNHTYIDYYFSWFNWHQCCVYISSIVCIQHYISGHIELTFLMLFPYYASFAIYMYNILTLCKIEVKILKKSYILKFPRGGTKSVGIRNKSPRRKREEKRKEKIIVNSISIKYNLFTIHINIHAKQSEYHHLL